MNIILLVFTCSCAALAFQAISQSIEKDWIPVLSNGTYPPALIYYEYIITSLFTNTGSSSWLSEVNAMISQIDLGCKSVAPAITGVLFSVMPANAVSILMVTHSLTHSYILTLLLIHFTSS